ncbi:ExeM/NucH family extracellular endonuclease [Sanguibacter sp. HDW7]|uniref:ExeM/NucH family extracellular endonuclease n=1 Tax=Sanguibacter sp. HDW7 TaxID=2714931 RepID=UPI00140AD545|nr:ExeM/NucH family extracellular endonuclease [Sanguibacter sp. HDW7]QIK82840.1 ExeM/NucH family extracellular endonuclease [Sanguibacter sp. HDW7]
MRKHPVRAGVVATLASASMIGTIGLVTAGAATAAVSPGAPVVINEAYGGGGNGGATLRRDFVELYNPGTAPIALDGYSVQYASAAGASWQVTALTGSIPAKGYFLVGQAAGAGGSVDLPAVDVNGSIPMSGTGFKVALVSSTTPLTCGATCAADPAVVDLVATGAGSAGAPAPAPSASTSISRTNGVNTANNAADFTAGAPTPTNAAGQTTPGTDPDPDPGDDPLERTIAEIQGTGDATPLAGKLVRTTGVVTAAYATGGFNGIVVQTPGADTTPGASDAIFVYLGSGNGAGGHAIGDHVTVTGTPAEFNGLTQITGPGLVVAADAAGTGAAVPLAIEWPEKDTDREAVESMLIAPQGDMTVTNTYSTGQYGEVGLAVGTTPLLQPTDVARPGTPEAADVAADNAARGVVLDDGASTNFTSSANQSQTPPYVSLSKPVRVGAKVTFDAPLVVDYRNNTWKLNPTSQVTPGQESATFENTRTDAPSATALGAGDLTIASFNVLNYFTTLGADVPGCTSYEDRAGTGITVRECTGDGPRGAWDGASLARQQAKIVAAIDALDASVVGLMEIENSAKLGENADEAVVTLVAALNALAGSERWDYVRSSADLPPVAEQDVITNAIIFQKAKVTPVGASVALGDLSGSGEPFVNAREPIGQAFAPAAGGAPFLAVVNHLKSKGSAGPLTGDADTGDGQGASNASRVAQATALKDWVPTVLADLATDGHQVADVALLGDFNSYAQEDPMKVLRDAGYTDSQTKNPATEHSYSFSGLSGSLDHVLLNDSMLARTTGADIWNINAPEAIALEYSRYNSHGTLFYDETPFRSSDHDPVIAAFRANTVSATSKLTFVNINDFHGRIDANTVKFAGTIEQLRKAGGEGSTLFLSAGDNIGASLFASAFAKDTPTLEVLDALGLEASAVGNHEFDQGFADLTGRVDTEADFTYLGANVYAKGTTNPALPEFKIVEKDGLKVGVIGVVTQETPTLVTPAGIKDLDFGDPVDAVNRVAVQLSDGDEANGEADVLVAEFHEGASAGDSESTTLETELAKSGAFTKIVEETSPLVDVIFTGHTHKKYAWLAPVTGGGTRPIVQTGNYGENVGVVEITVDRASGDVTDASARNVARTTTADTDLVAEFPRVAAVKTIVDKALADANEIGKQQVGSVTADITTAFTGGTYGPDGYVSSTPGTTVGRDNRGAESTMGRLVANALRDTLKGVQAGADIGVVNPGGLRGELLYARSGEETADGIVTYAEANAVLPFVNNLWSTTLTGAQLKVMLEQQWQTNPDGTIPSRSYLQLGLSDNVSYTYDSTRALGDRITSITVNGKSVVAADTFRVGTFSFLATGGDNFRVFTEGTSTVDSGLIDRDAWIAYLTAHPKLAPSFAEAAVEITGAPTTLSVGDAVSIGVKGLDLTSLGAKRNTSITATLHGGNLPATGIALGTATVTDGAATVTGTVPASAARATQVRLAVAGSGTVVTLHLDAAVAVPTGQKNLTLLNINDFHGRIDANTVKFAGTVEQLRKAGGEGSTLFLSAGDNIGASLFASAFAKDTPTLEVLNALGLEASAVGNHEFDQGFADLTGRVDTEADFAYLGANVYAKGTTNPALPEFKIVEKDGLKVGVIGVVTQETPTLVTPAGIASLDFGDPVEAVNRVAAQLSDGDESNGEADVLVAEFHEGASAGDTESTTLEAELAKGGAFAEIITETSPLVDVIFTGHTHKKYAWLAPVTGGGTRPVVQTGSYGENIGKVVLNVDTATNAVVSATVENVARTSASDASLVSAYPRVANVKQIVDDALAAANEVGKQQVGTVKADITTAYSGGSYGPDGFVGPGPKVTDGRDNRGAESTLGNLVANALRDTLAGVQAGADIGVVNPGGLRSDLLFAKSGDEATDGIVTFAEANAVLPFVNNLWSTTLTGAQLKTMLEQQWQTNADGTIPSRSYLQLGLSDNVSYTYDSTRALGDRITSITVNGKSVVAADTFRVGTFSFLATGGDNFRVFTEGTSTVDSGLIDRDAWMAYLTANQGLEPSFAERAVEVTGNPATVVAGTALSFGVAGLDLTSLGAKRNTSMTATFHGGTLPQAGVALGTIPVTEGVATVAGTVPAAAATATVLRLTAVPSGTVVEVPLTVTAPVVVDPVRTSTTLTVTGDRVEGRELTLTAKVTPAAAGVVEFLDGSKVVGRVTVASGTATLRTSSLAKGVHRLAARFVPTDPKAYLGSTSATSVVTIAARPVVKSAVSVSIKVSPSRVAYGTAAKATVTVVGRTAAPKGVVGIYDGNKRIALGTLKVSGRTGKVTVTLPKSLKTGTHRLTARYGGTSTTLAGTSSATSLKVVKAKPKVTVSVARDGRSITVRVSAKGFTPTGKVSVRVDKGRTKVVTLRKGTTKVTLEKPRRGKHVYTVSYSGTWDTESKTVKVTRVIR